ncbi:MAG: hypothetical protein GXY82_05215 [Methanospirillum sp.]|nr:hypothetical protein [Methanospirillum sp.]
MIADLAVSIVIYRSGGGFLAVCPEFGCEATGGSPEDAREGALAAVRRRLDAVSAEGRLEEVLARAGFVVDGGQLRAERRPIRIDEAILPVPF